MHIDQFKGLDGFELSKKQEKVFTAFLTDDTVDVGLGTLRATHVKAALYLAEEHANAKGLKKWHPMYERLMDLVYHDDSELLKKAKVLEIAALSWYAWGVLNEQAAFYGEHLITLALFLFGYGCVRSCLREDDAEEEKPFEPAIHSLPYMRDWFATSLPRDDDPMYSLYLSWLEQLKTEKESVNQLASGSQASDQECTLLLEARTERLRKAEAREADWLVEWLRTGIHHVPQPPFNIFQAVFLQNSQNPAASSAVDAPKKKRARVVSP